MIETTGETMRTIASVCRDWPYASNERRAADMKSIEVVFGTECVERLVAKIAVADDMDEPVRRAMRPVVQRAVGDVLDYAMYVDLLMGDVATIRTADVSAILAGYQCIVAVGHHLGDAHMPTNDAIDVIAERAIGILGEREQQFATVAIGMRMVTEGQQVDRLADALISLGLDTLKEKKQ